MKKIDKIITKYNDGEYVEDMINKLKNKLKSFRKIGLNRNGEFSYENLTFKFLRRNGYIEKLFKLKNKSINKKLSLKQ